MRFLAYLKENGQGEKEIVSQTETAMSDQDCIALDSLLRQIGKLGEDEEIAITEKA